MISFANPWALALLPVPLLLVWVLPLRQVAGRTLAVPGRIGAALVAATRAPEARGRGLVRRVGLPLLAWIAAVLALSGPRELAPVSALPVSGRDLAIVLDLSGSMVREDFALDGKAVTRLEAVTRIGARFARGRGGDRVALIVFGSEAYYAAPFTFDTEAVARRIEEAAIGVSGRATNISDGLGLALKRMADSSAESRVVVLLSDGSNNAGTAKPLAVADLAAQMGVRVHTIALGPKDETTAEEGERGVVDAGALRAIAQISGGETFRVRTSEDLAAVTQAIDALEANDAAGLAAEVYHAYWTWPAALAMLACLGLAWREAGA